MPQYARRICKYDFTIAVSSATTNVNLNPDDLSGAKSLRVEWYLATIGTDAGDSLYLELQSTRDGTTWDTRVRFSPVAGNTSAPRTYVAELLPTGRLVSSERVYEITGSSSTDIPAGTVQDGPFPGRRRTSAGMQPSWRLSFVQTDADSDAAYTGTVTIWANSDYSE